jgi:class 3 adenylate cyclase
MSDTDARTNGFLFADLRDYTRYVESHGDQAAAALLAEYRSLVRDAVGQFGGAEIKTEGDSFYVVFPSASSAVRCGLSIARGATEHTRAGGTPILVGVGVHAGETVETPEGYVGSAVNVAARVCGQAGPGELLVTDTVRALTRTFLPVRFVDRRTRRLKGVAEPMVLYRVEPLEAGASTGPRERPAGYRSYPGIRRTGRVAISVAGILLAGAASVYLLGVVLPGSRPAQSGLVGTDRMTSVPSAAAFPDPDEADLVAQLPMGIREACRRTDDPAERVGAVASVRCDLELAADADTVWYDRFGTLQQLSNALSEMIETQNLPRDVCAPAVSRGQANWQVGSTHTGRLLCYEMDGSHWIVWSYDADRIAARAVRRGDAPQDWVDLYQWWDQVRLFLR